MANRGSRCEAPTRFFKFIPPGCISQVSVPIAFRKYLKRLRKTKPAILKRGNQQWRVTINDDWVFGAGWEDFVTENGVQELEFVTFKHEGNMVFNTMVFDLTWCEKEYPTHRQVAEKKTQTAASLEATSVVEYRYDARGLPNETTAMKVVRNPSFNSIIAPYSVENNYVDIPVEFARSSKWVGRNCKSVVMDENRKLWPTKLCTTKDRVRIRGLRNAWAANGFKLGDTFLLEVVDNGEKPVLNLYKVREFVGSIIY